MPKGQHSCSAKNSRNSLDRKQIAISNQMGKDILIGHLPYNTQLTYSLQRSIGNKALSQLIIQRLTPSTATSEQHNKAKENHAQDKAALKNFIATPPDDKRLANSIRWYQQGKSKLYVLTRTADSADRGALAAKSGKAQQRELAFFGSNILTEEGGTYNEKDMEDHQNIKFSPEESGGFRLATGGEVYVLEPSCPGQREGRPSIGEVLKHETQHEADIDFNLDYMAKGGNDLNGPDYAFNTYKTEFRAYTAQEAPWLSEDTDQKSDHNIPPGMTDNWISKTHKNIFLHIYKRYPKVKAAWDHNAVLSDGTKFRNAAQSFSGDITMISANPDNSPEVHQFWSLLSEMRVSVQTSADLWKVSQQLSDKELEIFAKSKDRLRQIFTKQWKIALVEAIAKKDRNAFEKVIEQVQAKKEKKQKKRSPRRSGPPEWEDVKTLGSWEVLSKLALENAKPREGQTREDIQNDIQDDLAIFSRDSSWDEKNKSSIEAFVSNTANYFDWWPVLKEYQLEKNK